MINLEDCFNSYGEKPKLVYCQYQVSHQPTSIFTYGLDVAKKDEAFYILITGLGPILSGVSNHIEEIVTTLYLTLQLHNWAQKDSMMHWYQLDLSEGGIERQLPITEVRLKWNGMQFENPDWIRINPKDAPFDLSEFVETRELYKKSGGMARKIAITKLLG